MEFTKTVQIKMTSSHFFSPTSKKKLPNSDVIYDSSLS